MYAENNLDGGIILNKKENSGMYIGNYYEKLYDEEPFDETKQKWILDLVDDTLNEIDKDTLATEITEEEIFNTIKGLNANESQGIDGIPIEFYYKFWSIIKVELVEIIKNIIEGTHLSSSKKIAILTLQPKGGDLKELKSWRPI